MSLFFPCGSAQLIALGRTHMPGYSVPSDLPLLAAALGLGVQRAALLSYDQARDMLGQEGISETVAGQTDDGWVNFDIRAVQALTDWAGECIEIKVLATDGRREIDAYLYVRPVSSNA